MTTPTEALKLVMDYPDVRTYLGRQVSDVADAALAQAEPPDHFPDAGEMVQAEQAPVVTPSMVETYLSANALYWQRIDADPGKLGVWRNGTPREATEYALNIALALAAPPAEQPAEQAQPVAPDCLSMDDDGDVSIDFRAGDDMLTMSVSKTGRLAYAWRTPEATNEPRGSGEVHVHVAVHEVLRAALAAPPAAQPLTPWVPVAERMPDSGETVLACYVNSNGRVRRIRAEWIAAKSLEASIESEIGEYDEDSDTYYTPEGWYEKIDNWDDYSSVAVHMGEITHWMPLPAAPTDSGIGTKPAGEQA